MKHLVILIAAACFPLNFLNAQQPARYEHGSFGHFYSGVTYMNFNGLRTYVNEPDVLRHVQMPYTLYTQIGGEWMVVSERLMTGSGVYGLTNPPINIDSVEFDVNGYGGYIKLGYHYLQTTTSFAYSFVGFGIGNSSLNITNTGAQTENKTGRALAPKESILFAEGLYFVDAGTGYKLVFTPEGSKNIGGVTVGIDGGCKLYISSTPPNASSEQRNVSTNANHTVLVPYAHITFGFSHFKRSTPIGR